MVHQDIVHGDVKCENVLVFEKEDADRQGDNGMPRPRLINE